MEKSLVAYGSDLNLGVTELRLGLPGSEDPSKQSCVSDVKRNKRAFSDIIEEVKEKSSSQSNSDSCEDRNVAPPANGWPPIRSYRKNTLKHSKDAQNNDGARMFVKVSMDGAPYLKKGWL